MITPVDLETVVFTKSLHGYNVREIQDFLAQLTPDFEHLYRENIELKEKLEDLKAKLNQYQLIEETLRNTMVMAQETAEEAKNSARQQANLIIKEAQQQEEKIRLKVTEDIQAELRNLALLKNQGEYFKCQFKSFLTGLLDLAEKQFDMHVVWEASQAVATSAPESTIKQI